MPARESELITAAWVNTVVDLPSHIPTMISPEERQYLFWLGSCMWQGRGIVVEIGPWLGGSTWCLAAGMQQSGHDPSRRLVVYDNFIWRQFMSSRAQLDLNPGDCFQSVFLGNIKKFDFIVDAWKQTLPDEVISGDQEAESKRYVNTEQVAVFQGLPGSEPAEILFVDGAKSWLGLKHLLLNVHDRLLPGESILVCQDFKYWGNYWVPLMLTMLGDCIEPIHNVVSATTVTFRLTSPLEFSRVNELPDHIADVSTSEAVQAINEAADLLLVCEDRQVLRRFGWARS